MINEKIETKQWGLVLNGGGGKGAYQIGVFKALKELGMDKNIMAVAGASVGALNTALWPFDISVCEQAWNSITPEKFIDIELEMLDKEEGLVSRDGLVEIMNKYVDMNVIRDYRYPLVASVTEYDENGEGVPEVRYMSLNGKSEEDIKNILLASSALPVIYEPVAMNGHKYRDGGLTDNLPVKPLYSIGIRHMIVVCLSMEEPDLSAYPDVEFVVIKPSRSIGEFITGTLDFTPEGSALRMELGYIDGKRILQYYGNPYVNMEELKENSLNLFEAKLRMKSAVDEASEHMNLLKDIFDKYS